MPNFLIVSATKQEIQPLLNHFSVQLTGEETLAGSDVVKDLSVIVTGVGMVNTAFVMGKFFNHKFDFIINLGICGTLHSHLKIGEVVNVVSDTICEMGAESPVGFIKYPDLIAGGINYYENKINDEPELLATIKKVKALTVNKVHGIEESIEQIKSLYEADVESMEGAAFLRAADGMGINYLQLRAISNYVENRDKSKWNIALAIKNLNEFAIKLITNYKNI
ncbi:MAG: futalosine hydrolase [Bacteroidetes bacterium]|nr:futalosine hydrolase [Bacteroidota bacterium]